MKKFLLYLVIGLGYAHAQPSPYTNAKFPPTVISASGITSAPIDLATYGSSVGNSFATGTVTLTGSSLTTATFGVLGSSDGGVTYFPVNISTITAPGTVATTATATANGLYYVNLAGLDHIEFVTSGTFTATSISLKLSATPNGLIARNTGGGGSGCISSGGQGTVQAAGAVAGTCQATLIGDTGANVISVNQPGLAAGQNMLLEVGKSSSAHNAVFFGWFNTAIPYGSAQTFSKGDPLEVAGSQIWLDGGNVYVGNSSATGAVQPSGGGLLNVGTTNQFQVAPTGVASTAGVSLVGGSGALTVNQAACIKSAGPPVTLGICSTVVSASGACTCS